MSKYQRKKKDAACGVVSYDGLDKSGFFSIREVCHDPPDTESQASHVRELRLPQFYHAMARTPLNLDITLEPHGLNRNALPSRLA